MITSKSICVTDGKVARIKILNELGFKGFEWCLTITPEEIREKQKKSGWVNYRVMPIFIHADFKTMSLYDDTGSRRETYSNINEMVTEIIEVLNHKSISQLKELESEIKVNQYKLEQSILKKEEHEKQHLKSCQKYDAILSSLT